MSEVKIPQALLNVIADVNIEEINSHIYTNESMLNWLCAWHEEVKRELYDFANNHELYEQGRADVIDSLRDVFDYDLFKLYSNDDRFISFNNLSLMISDIIEELKEKNNG